MSFDNPCTRDCPDRSGGCQVSCPRWAEYVAARNAKYIRRWKKADQGKLEYSAAQERRHRHYMKKH